MSTKEKVILFLLAALNFTHILDFMIMMPLGNHLMPHFKIDAKAFAVLVSSYSYAAAPTSFLAAFFADSFDRKKFLLFGFIGFAIATFCCGMAPTYGILLAARIVAGLFGGIIGAQVIAIVSDMFTYERRGQAMGAVMSSFAVASSFGVPAALFLANKISWHAPFLVVAGVGFALLPLLYKYVPNMQAHIHNNEKATFASKLALMTDTFKNTVQRRALLFSGLMMFSHFIIIPFINPYMEFNLGYNKELTPLIYLFGGISALVASFFIGKLADKVGKLKVFVVCLLISLPLMLLITNLARVPYVYVLATFAIWFFVATGRGISAQAMVSSVVTPEHRGAFQSFNSCLQQLGTGTAAFLAGYIVKTNPNKSIQHYNWLGFIGTTAMVITLILAVNLFRNLKVKN
jgi:MFS transporter, DHA1 family, inner membrane transport protein